jgi:hypothetical protein
LLPADGGSEIALKASYTVPLSTVQHLPVEEYNYGFHFSSPRVAYKTDTNVRATHFAFFTRKLSHGVYYIQAEQMKEKERERFS